ncbi:MAG: PorP/SprF family type IX secretion system membrane protein [Bacteroidota bacterium]
MQKRFHLKFLYKYLVLLVFLIFGQVCKSQMVYLGNLYSFNKYQLNPAYAGSKGDLSAILSYRNVTSTIQGAPRQLMFGLHMPVFNRMGLGTRIENQTEGLFHLFTGFIDYSYNVDFSYNQSLRFGISAGIRSSQLDNSKIIATDPSAIVEIASKFFLGTSFESAAGIVYQWKGLEINIAVPRLYGTSKEFNPVFTSWLAYHFESLDDKLVLTPNIFIMHKPGTPLVYDINLMAKWQEKFMVGVGYRNRPGIVLSAGVSFANIRLNYAAEISAEKYANIFNTIHEVSVAYQFNKVKELPADSLYNPPLDLIVKADSISSDSITDISNRDSITDIFTPDSLTEISYQDSAIGTSKQDSISENLADKNLDIEQDSVVNLREDSTSIHKKEPEFEIVELGNGIFELKLLGKSSEPINENQVDNLLKTKMFHGNRDVSVISAEDDGKMINNSGKYEIIEVGSGIYSIKENESNKLIKSEIPEELIDSLYTLNKFASGYENNSKSVNNKKSDYFHEVYYTVQVFIDSKSNILMKDYELAEQLRVEKSTTGKINYYYGKFSEKKSAERARNYLIKKGLINIEVLKVSAYQ